MSVGQNIGDTFIYTPGVEVLILTRHDGVIDVSPDLISGSLTLHENQPHSFSFTLANEGRQYDGIFNPNSPHHIFTPNDRITVRMKRISWLSIFAGYLDEVPFFSATPRSVSMSATCTLKRLQYHWWDPGSPASVALLTSVIGKSENDKDGGMKEVTQQVLANVGGWDPSLIHIANIPQDWATQIDALFNLVEPSIGVNQIGSKAASAATVGGGAIADGKSTVTPVGPGTGVLPQPASGGATPFGGLVAGAGWPHFGNMALTNENVAIPDDTWYMAMRWPYLATDPNGQPQTFLTPDQQTTAQAFWVNRRMLVVNAYTGDAIIARAADWGPIGDVSNAMGLSPEALIALNGDTTTNFEVQFAPDNVPLGVYKAGQQPTQNSISDPASGTTNSIIAGNSSGVTGNLVPNDTGTNNVLRQSYTGNNSTNNTQVLSYTAASAVNGQSLGAGAVVAAKSQLGVNYVWGGETAGQAMDCSGLMQYAWGQVGVTISHYTGTQMQDDCVSVADTQLLPGDLIFYDGSPPGHVAMFIGGGQVIHAPHTGTVVQITSMTYMGTSVGNGRPKAAITNEPIGTTAGANGAFQTLAFDSSGAVGGTGAGSNAAASYTGNNFFKSGSWTPLPSQNSSLYTGELAYLNDTPLLPDIGQYMQASMRSFCSGPDGSFIAWFPDYFGNFNTAGKITIRDIELEDFQMQWSDSHLITHQFGEAPMPGAVSFSPTNPGLGLDASSVLQSQLVTVEWPQVLASLLNINSANQPGLDPIFYDPQQILSWFGPRPDFKTIGTILATNRKALFWFTAYQFMQNWAEQFNAGSVPITFMPEMFPGMLMVLESYHVQFYVTDVTHTFDFSEGGGFKTQVSVKAPSATDSKGLAGLILGNQTKQTPVAGAPTTAPSLPGNASPNSPTTNPTSDNGVTPGGNPVPSAPATTNAPPVVPPSVYTQPPSGTAAV